MRHELILHTGPLGPAKRPEVETSDPAEAWRPHDTNPEVEVNGRGQLRTKAPPAPPQPVWPFQVSFNVDTADADETCVLLPMESAVYRMGEQALVTGTYAGKGCWGLSVSEIEATIGGYRRRLADERTKKLRELVDNIVLTGTVPMAPYFRSIGPQELYPG